MNVVQYYKVEEEFCNHDAECTISPSLKGIPFSAVTFEVSFLSVIALLLVSVVYHLKAYVVNFQNSHIILIWLPWQRY